MGPSTAVLLTLSQRQEVVKECFGILGAAVWRRFHLKHEDQLDFLQLCFEHYYRNKERKYMFSGSSDLETERRHYKRFVLFVIQQNMTRVWKEFRRDYGHHHEYIEDEQQRIEEEHQLSAITIITAAEDRLHADALKTDMFKYLKTVFQGWEIRKLRYYVRRKSRGDKISLVHYFGADAARVQKKFKFHCAKFMEKQLCEAA